MMITNGTLSDIENWFYEGNHKYYWMAILLPSLQSCGIIRQLLDDIERIDRITADNVAFMTFFNEQEFDDVSRQCGLQRHVLFIYPDIETYLKVKKTIWEDPVFRRESESFYNITASDPVYSNFESYLSEAFDKIPVHRIPDPVRTMFELRIYHSPNEEANQRKVKMFNKEEIDLFDQVAINSVLYGEILAGPRMPALLYLTWYNNEETRSEAWKKFGSHPEWKRMSVLPEYANTATNNRSIFLSPMPYSQL